MNLNTLQMCNVMHLSSYCYMTDFLNPQGFKKKLTKKQIFKQTQTWKHVSLFFPS